jgi:putative transposase
LTYAFIAANQPSWPVSVLCEVLGVGRSGFYAYQKRQAAPARSRKEIDVLARIKAISEKTHHSSGSRRMTRQLQDEGHEVGRFTGRRFMQQAGVSVEGRRRRGPKTTESRHGYGVAPNLLERHCDVMAPNVAWGGDITFIWTEEGGWYTSVLVDLYARKVVGWAMSDHVDTPLVTDALEMALGRRQPNAGLIHHSDRGSQYASHAYRSLLAEYGIECSMRGKGDCLDNAVAERFFGSLKREPTSKRYYRTRQEARDEVIDDIAMFYNSWRKHSYLGSVSPNAYEKIARAAAFCVRFYLTTTR